MRNDSRCCARVLLVALVSSLACPAANAAIEVIGVQYQPDAAFPEYNCYWSNNNYPTSCPDRVVAANVHVYVKNTGVSSVTISDVNLAGYSLKTVIKYQDFRGHFPFSIYYYWDNPPQDIFDAGEPIWFKGDPGPIPAGGVGQAVVRLRRIPVTGTIAVGVVTTAGTVTTNITVDAAVPHLASVTFSTTLTKVYLHWRRTNGAAPTTIWMDGTNVTANATTVGDASVNFAATVLQLAAPLTLGSYHVFQGVYADGKMGSASLRAWVNNYIYGIWGGKSGADNDTAAGQAWVDECEDHGVNAQIMTGCNLVNDLVKTAAGRQYCLDHNFGFVVDAIGDAGGTTPLMWFLDDEPDNEEGVLLENSCGDGYKLPCGSNPTGVLGMHFIPLGETLRAASPISPTTINLNGSYKPYSWQVYGQLADVLMMDAYYDARIRDSYWDDPQLIPLYSKPTMIYPFALAATTAAEPNPFHMLLDCFQTVVGNIWPFPDPGSKRVEVYYALAGGAKGMGYWWFNKPRGIDVWTPDAHALWKEMGLLGNEIKTVAPLLVNGHPVAMTATGSANVWVKSLAVGTDTMILFVVNQNHYNDSAGTFHYTPLNNATVTATLPAWMQWPIAFEVSAGGLVAVNTQTNGNQFQINLGTLTLTRMIVLTTNPQVPLATQQRYVQSVRPGICTMASEFCTNSKPVIVVQPQSQVVLVNSNATFVVTANATPSPTYQWRYNDTNLSGATSATYTRTNAQVSHNGGYSVVVSNSLGSVTSVVANLTVSTNGFPPSIVSPPASQSVTVGVNATFNVTANGTEPLSYQWRFNGGALANATDTAFTRTNTQVADGGIYDVVVVNGSGSVTSSPATLSVTVPCPSPGLLNASFESGNTGGVATSWTGYQRAPNPTTIWTIQIANPPAGAGTNYQQIANTSSTGGGGVRQDITGCTIGATYSIAGWMRGNSTNSTVTVKVSPTASTSWSSAADLTPPQTMNGASWLTFSGTVVATSTSMTLWLDGRTGSTGQNNAACFDAIVVTCEGMPAQPPTITQQPSDQAVAVGGTASFTVGAAGSEPLGYQWQKNNTNLSNGGQYSGATTTTLTITGADTNDAANYRCVVTNNLGSTNSIAATLTVTQASFACISILNAGFEDGFTLAGGGYIANNWTEWETSPGVIIGYDETGIVHGGAHAQRLRVSSTDATSGGVYQRIPVTSGALCSVSVWIYSDTALTSCYLGVDAAGGTNANSGGVWSSATTNVAWVQKTWIGTATANYITVFYKVATPDNVKRNGYFDDATPSGSGGPLQLTAQRNGNDLTLLWPECPAAHLERADSLTAPLSWTTVTNQVSVVGGQKSMTLTPTGVAGYFRLIME